MQCSPDAEVFEGIGGCTRLTWLEAEMVASWPLCCSASKSLQAELPAADAFLPLRRLLAALDTEVPEGSSSRSLLLPDCRVCSTMDSQKL